MKITTRKDIGDLAEKKAGRYLKKQKLKIICKNFACKTGEIDLIAFDKTNSEIVFVEVRYREFGIDEAIKSVNYPKRKRIISASRFFLATNRQYEEMFLRYDIIAVTKDENNKWLIEHIPDAFRKA